MCIAINRNRDIEIIEEIKDNVHENYLLLHCKIDQKEMLIGGGGGCMGQKTKIGSSLENLLVLWRGLTYLRYWEGIGIRLLMGTGGRKPRPRK
jgi:hypothetical protein